MIHVVLAIFLSPALGNLQRQTFRLGAGNRLGGAAEDELDGLLFDNIKDELGIDDGRLMTLEELRNMGRHEDFDGAIDQLDDLHQWIGSSVVDPLEDKDWDKILEAMEEPEWELIAGSSEESNEEGDDESEDFDIYTLPALHKWWGDELVAPLQDRDFEKAHAAMSADPYDLFDDLEEDELDAAPGLLFKDIKDELGIEDGRVMTLEELRNMGRHEDFDGAVDQLDDLHQWLESAVVDPIEDKDWIKILEAMEEPEWELIAGSSEEYDEESDDESDVDIYTFPAVHKWWGDEFVDPLQERDFERVHAAMNDDPYDLFDDLEEESDGPLDCIDIARLGDMEEETFYTVYPFGDLSYPVQVVCTSHPRDGSVHTLFYVDPTTNYGYREKRRLAEGWKCDSTNYQKDWEKAGKTAYPFYELKVDRDTGNVYIDSSSESYTYWFLEAQVPPGHGGSCYSWNACDNAKKGEFSVDLEGTGLGISSSASWKVTGWGNGKQTVRNFVSTDSKRSGNCGAWCGECGPVDDKIPVTPAGFPDWRK